MSLWGENRVLKAMTSVAIGGRSECLAEKIEGAQSTAPVLPEIQSSLFLMQTGTRGSRDGCSDRIGHEPSIHPFGVISKLGTVELAPRARLSI